MPTPENELILLNSNVYRSMQGTSMSSLRLFFIILLINLALATCMEIEGLPASQSSKADPQTILRYLETGDTDAAHEALTASFAVSERNPNPDLVEVKLSQRKIRRGGGLTYTSAYKLGADLEQANYLAAHLDDPEKVRFFANVVIPIYKRVLERIPPLDELEKSFGLYTFQQEDIDDGILNIYNKALHLPNVDEFSREDGSRIPMFSSSFDSEKIEKQWFGEEPEAQPGVVVIDDFLSQEALARIRKLMLESTVWYQTKLPKKFGGYTGAYIDDGLNDRILLVLAAELRRALPRILQAHPLKYMWSYKASISTDHPQLRLIHFSH
jgi:hypothetical protein